MNGYIQVFFFRPLGLVVREGMWVVEVETQDDIRVTAGNSQFVESVDTLPTVGADDELTFGFRLPEFTNQLGGKRVPL